MGEGEATSGRREGVDRTGRSGRDEAKAQCEGGCRRLRAATCMYVLYEYLKVCGATGTLALPCPALPCSALLC